MKISKKRIKRNMQAMYRYLYEYPIIEDIFTIREYFTGWLDHIYHTIDRKNKYWRFRHCDLLNAVGRIKLKRILGINDEN